MTKIIVGGELAGQLGQLKGQALIYDASGRPLGVFSPSEQPVQAESVLSDDLPSIEETEELRKRARENPGKPLEEILSRLGF